MNIRSLVKLSICLMIFHILPSHSGDLNLKKVPLRSLPGWKQDASEHFIPAFLQSCSPILKQKKINPRSNDLRSSHAWQHVCTLAAHLPTPLDRKTAKRFIESWFNAYSINPKENSGGLFTGYYEPTYAGSEVRTAEYHIPIYAYPSRTKKLRNSQGEVQLHYLSERLYHPFPEREKISSSPLMPGLPVIAWMRSKIDRFFMEIQGSGSIITPEGKRILLGYGGQNGYAYFPIGRHLVQSGALSRENVSMQTIRTWLLTHPEESEAVMNRNPSFVFFRKLDTTQPLGAQGVPLTPGRSLAVDHRYIPYGTPIFIDTSLPELRENKIVPGLPLQRLMIAQDTGGAIRGPIRGDVFWGHGSRAEWLAGHMQSSGRAWILLPRGMSTSHIRAF